MPYYKPNVWVTVTLAAPNPALYTPLLKPCIIGPHYLIYKDQYVSNVEAADVTTFSYPGLPKSWNNPAVDLEADISDALYKPTATLVLTNGTEIDVTSNLTFTATQISKPDWSTLTHAASGLPYKGALYVSFRALSDEYSGVNEELLEVSSIDDLIGYFGSDGIGPANPLGFGMYNALIHGQISVRGAAIGDLPDQNGAGTYSGEITDIMLSYARTLDFLKSQDVYMLVPMTNNDYVLDLVLSHCDAQSATVIGDERRMVFGVNMNDYWPVRGDDSHEVWFSIKAADATGATILNDGTDPTLAEDETAVGYEFEIGNYTLRRIATGNCQAFGQIIVKGHTMAANTDTLDLGGETMAVEFFDGTTTYKYWVEFSYSAFKPATNRIRVGDYLHIEGEFTYDVDEMGTVTYPGIAGFERLVEVDFETNYAHALNAQSKRVRVYREQTLKDKAEGLAQMGQSYDNERLMIVAPEYVAMLIENVEMDVPSFYVAAQVAAEACLVGRRQAGPDIGAYPFTGVRDSVVEIWQSNRYFTEEQLDTAAEGGIAWLVNANKGLPITLRDALSTDMKLIETRQFILGVERDFLAKTYRKALRPFLKKYRINNKLLQLLQVQCDAIAGDLTNPILPTYTFRDIKTVKVEQNDAKPDQVDIQVEARHLYVLKYILVDIAIV